MLNYSVAELRFTRCLRYVEYYTACEKSVNVTICYIKSC